MAILIPLFVIPSEAEGSLIRYYPPELSMLANTRIMATTNSGALVATEYIRDPSASLGMTRCCVVFAK